MTSTKYSKSGGRLPPKPKPVQYRLPVEYYTPYHLQQLIATAEGAKAARKEYTRLRNIAEKRIKRLRGDKLLSRLESVKDTISTGFPTLREIGSSPQALAGHLSGLRRFLSTEESTVYGARRKFERNVAKAQEATAGYVDETKYPDFDRFMSFAKGATRGFRIGSPEMAEFFDEHSGEYASQEELESAFVAWIEQDDT